MALFRVGWQRSDTAWAAVPRHEAAAVRVCLERPVADGGFAPVSGVRGPSAPASDFVLLSGGSYAGTENSVGRR